MAVIEKGIDVRERAGTTFVITTRNHGTKDLPTAAALFSGDSSTICCSYCGQSHSHSRQWLVLMPGSKY